MYQPGTGPFTVVLSARRHAYTVRWLSVTDGRGVQGSPFRAGGVKTLRAPFAGPAVVLLQAR